MNRFAGNNVACWYTPVNQKGNKRDHVPSVSNGQFCLCCLFLACCWIKSSWKLFFMDGIQLLLGNLVIISSNSWRQNVFLLFSDAHIRRYLAYHISVVFRRFHWITAFLVVNGLMVVPRTIDKTGQIEVNWTSKFFF